MLYNILIPSPDSSQIHPSLPYSPNFMSFFFNPSSSVYAALIVIGVRHSLEGPYPKINLTLPFLTDQMPICSCGALCPPPLSKLKFCLAWVLCKPFEDSLDYYEFVSNELRDYRERPFSRTNKQQEDVPKNNMKTYYCRSFLKCIHTHT